MEKQNQSTDKSRLRYARQNLVPLKELNLSNRFLFDQVLEDAETMQEVLSIVIGKDVSLLLKSETEKELRLSALIRSIRMDVFAFDTDQTAYNAEMQNGRREDLEKRSRYYQALLDTSLLDPGIPNYNLLNNSFLIMITTFDLFGYGKYRYTFLPVCQEVPECRLRDGAVRMFLNTRGTNEDEVPSELVEFLHYIEHSTDAEADAAKSERIRKIHERVCKVRLSEEVGVKYMQAWEERYYDCEEARKDGYEDGKAEGKAEGKEEGKAEGRRNLLLELIRKNREKGRSAEEIAELLDVPEEVIRSAEKQENRA